MTNIFVKRDNYKWIILVISFLLALIFSICLQSLPPIFGNIMSDIPFSNSQAGQLMSAYSIMGIFIPFLVAFFANTFDIKKTVITALIIMITGLIGFSLSTSFPLLLIHRVISGTGATILIVLAPLLVTMFFDEDNMGIAMGVFNTAVPFGAVLSANLFGYLGELMNWRVIIRGIAIFAIGILFIILFFLYLPKEEKKDISSPKTKSRIGVNLWFLGAIWMLVNAQLLTYITFGPQFYQLSGVSTQQASFLTSLVMLMSVFLAPVVGVLMDKTGQKKPFLLIGSVIMGLSFVFITTTLLPLAFWAVALGIGLAPIPVGVFAILPDIVREEQISMGMATLTCASNLGITIGPVAFGSFLDRTSGSFFSGFIILSILSLIVVFMSLKLSTKKGIKTKD